MIRKIQEISFCTAKPGRTRLPETTMHQGMKRTVMCFFLVIFALLSGGCGYNRMVTLQEGVDSAWAQVQNVYQRRLDLIPNLVETVKGYAKQEQETLRAVTEARSRAGGTMQVDENLLNDPAAFERFQKAQNSLGSALQRLLVITENYPDLKSNQNFLALQSQLEGTENRITVERGRFNEAVRNYNTAIRRFPRVMYARRMGFEPRPYFEATAGAETAPQVKF